MLYSESAACYLIGCLCNTPSLLRNGKYPLKMEDFSPNRLHQFLFAIINNLAQEGLEEITEIEIDQYSQPYKEIKEVFQDEDALEFIHLVKEQSTKGTVDLYYNTVKKYALLRSAQSKGYDISAVYDETEIDTEKNKIFSKITITDLLNYFETKSIELKREFLPNNVKKESWAGSTFKKVLEMFESEPVIGAGLNSPYENTIWRGWQRGHLLMRSGGSASGKTTRMIGDICHVCVKYLWDNERNEFVLNPSYEGGGFYIHTEMDQDTELQPKFLSYITDLPFNYILDGQYSSDIKKRLWDAADILIDSKIKLINLPDFTIPLLTNTIKEHTIVNKCKYGVFDYVEDNGTAGKIYKQEVGTNLRSDMVLLAIVSQLKTIAEECKIGLLTGSQLNGNEKTAIVVDESCLAGSKAMKNKLDGGSIIMRPTKKELEQTRLLGNKYGFGNEICNMVSHIYKGRFSSFGNNLKVFHKFDYSTGRIEDLYVTKAFNEPLDIEKTFINNIEEE